MSPERLGLVSSEHSADASVIRDEWVYVLSLRRLKQVMVHIDRNIASRQTSPVPAITARARAREMLLKSSARTHRVTSMMNCINVRIATTVCPRSWVGGTFEVAGFASLARNPASAQVLVGIHHQSTVRQVANGLVRRILH